VVAGSGMCGGSTSATASQSVHKRWLGPSSSDGSGWAVSTMSSSVWHFECW